MSRPAVLFPLFAELETLGELTTIAWAKGCQILEMLGESAGIDVADLIDAMARVVYGSVIAVSLLYQGGMALYFLRRAPLVERNARETPEWARETLAKL